MRTPFLIARARDVAVEVAIDGIPLNRLNGGELSEEGEFAGRWIDGTHAFLEVVVLGPGRQRDGPGIVGTDGRSLTPPLINASVRAEILLIDPRVTGVPTGPSAGRIDWRADATSRPPVFPVRLRAPITVPPGLASPRWTVSRLPGDLQSLREPLLAWLRRLQRAIGEGDAAFLVDAARPGLLDLADSIGVDREDQIAQFRRLFAANSPVRDLEPIDAATTELRSVAGGRLIACYRRDGRPIIVTAARADPPFAYEVRVGMIDDRWCLF